MDGPAVTNATWSERRMRHQRRVGVKTRDASDADIDLLSDIFSRAMGPYIAAARGGWDPVKEEDQFRRQLRLDSTRIIVENDAVVGYFMAYDQGRDVELHTLCISPEHQRQGLGATVIRRILADARRRERGVVLSVLKTNVGARSLYQRFGFVVTNETAHHYRMRLEF
jgi:ribosomal protein S18 acetylase RimI-like enzyme